MTTPRPPDGLGPAGRSFWRRILAAYDLSPAEAALLTRACRTIDVLARIDRQLGREQLLVTGSTGQPRANPLLASKADQERTLAALVAAMALPMPDEQTGRRRSPQQTAAAQERWRKGRRGGSLAQ